MTYTATIYYPDGIQGVSPNYGTDTVRLYGYDRGTLEGPQTRGTSGATPEYNSNQNYEIGDHITVEGGTKVLFSATPNDGMSFLGWYNQSNQVGTNQQLVQTVNSDILLYPKYDVDTERTERVSVSMSIEHIQPSGQPIPSGMGVVLSSLYGYYSQSYDVSTPSRAVTIRTASSDMYVDVSVKTVDGFRILVRVDTDNSSVTVDPTEPNRGDQQAGDQQAETVHYRVPVLPTSSTSTNTITVTYSAATQKVTANFRTEPSGKGRIQYSTNNGLTYIDVPDSGKVTLNKDSLVTIRAVDASAGYSFDSWDISTAPWNPEENATVVDRGAEPEETSNTSNPYSFNIDSDRWITARFTDGNAKLTVKSRILGTETQSTSGEFACILVNGRGVAGNSISASSIPQGANVEIQANQYIQGCVFLYWEDASTSAPEQYSSQNTVPVMFGNTDTVSKTYCAVFKQVSQKNILVPAFIHVSEARGVQGINFTMSYTDASGSTSTNTVSSMGPGSPNYGTVAKLETSGEYTSTTIRLGYQYQTVDIDGVRYRCDITGYKYKQGCSISSDRVSDWEDLTPDKNNEFTIYAGEVPSMVGSNTIRVDKDFPCTICAMCELTRLYKLHVYPDCGILYSMSPADRNDIIVSNIVDGAEQGKSGTSLDLYFEEGTTVEIASRISEGIDTNLFVFDGFELNDVASPYGDTQYGYVTTFDMPSEDSKLVARWTARNVVQFSIDGDAGSQIECEDDEHNHIYPEDHVEYGSTLYFTVTPASGISVSGWYVMGNQSSDDAGESLRTIASASPKNDRGIFNVVCKVSSNQNVDVLITDYGDGETTLESYDGSSWSTVQPILHEPSTGLVTNKYSIPYGSKIRLTARPNQNSQFTQFIIGDGTTISQNPYTIDSVTERTEIKAIYSKVQWISTLPTIIKVW